MVKEGDIVKKGQILISGRMIYKKNIEGIDNSIANEVKYGTCKGYSTS